MTLLANRANMLANRLTNNVGSNVDQHVDTAFRIFLKHISNHLCLPFTIFIKNVPPVMFDTVVNACLMLNKSNIYIYI